MFEIFPFMFSNELLQTDRNIKLILEILLSTHYDIKSNIYCAARQKTAEWRLQWKKT